MHSSPWLCDITHTHTQFMYSTYTVTFLQTPLLTSCTGTPCSSNKLGSSRSWEAPEWFATGTKQRARLSIFVVIMSMTDTGWPMLTRRCRLLWKAKHFVRVRGVVLAVVQHFEAFGSKSAAKVSLPDGGVSLRSDIATHLCPGLRGSNGETDTVLTGKDLNILQIPTVTTE